MPLPISIRQSVLEAVKARLESVSGLADPVNSNTDPEKYPLSFSRVELGPLTETDNRKRYTAGIVPGREAKHTSFPIVTCKLPVTIEFRMYKNKGDDAPATEAEKVLTVIQRIIMSDRTLGGLALDMVETGNEIDLTDYEDKSIVGAVFWEVTYRHSVGDPRTIVNA